MPKSDAYQRHGAGAARQPTVVTSEMVSDTRSRKSTEYLSECQDLVRSSSQLHYSIKSKSVRLIISFKNLEYEMRWKSE